MTYPLISEYVAAIKDAAGNLDRLAKLEPVLDNDDEPIHSGGAFAVVFKMVGDNGKYYALKCFTEEQTGRAEAYKLIAEELEIVNSSYMLNVEYYDKELFVDSNVTEDTEFPVLLMDWVDGETMDKFIADNYADEYEMSWLCYRFCKMAAWLRSQPFAHGDLKPDNIIVREDGELVLIDYDGMFVPAMKGQKSPTLGTKDFVHPNRKVEDFDETIDDFTLASIALSLKAISLDPSLYEKYAKPDRLLFSSADYLDLGKCEVLNAIHSLMNDVDLVKLKGLFEYSLASGNLSSVSFRSFVLTKPVVEKTCKYTLEEIKAMSKVSKEELAEIDWDETGAKYSKDGKRLLIAKGGAFTIRKGTMVVCEEVFWLDNLTEITIPDSVISIGDSAFGCCCGLTEITIPKSITSIGNLAFASCRGLTKITIPKSVTNIGSLAFAGCSGLTTIKVDIDNIVYDSRNNCNAIIESKSNELICACKSTIIPESVTSIGVGAFDGCSGLTEIIIPESIRCIGKSAFRGCTSLTEITIPDGVTSIGESAFAGCNCLTKITIPNGITCIGNCVFEDCRNLTEITIPDNVTSIGENAFKGCDNLTKVTVPNGITCIGNCAFEDCWDLTEITIPNGVICIGYSAFENCWDLTEITIPDGVIRIGDRTFYGCSGLTEITIPNSVISIGDWAFSGCDFLERIFIPLGTRDKFIKMLGMEFSRLIVEQ